MRGWCCRGVVCPPRPTLTSHPPLFTSADELERTREELHGAHAALQAGRAQAEADGARLARSVEEAQQAYDAQLAKARKAEASLGALGAAAEAAETARQATAAEAAAGVASARAEAEVARTRCADVEALCGSLHEEMNAEKAAAAAARAAQSEAATALSAAEKEVGRLRAEVGVAREGKETVIETSLEQGAVAADAIRNLSARNAALEQCVTRQDLARASVIRERDVSRARTAVLEQRSRLAGAATMGDYPERPRLAIGGRVEEIAVTPPRQQQQRPRRGGGRGGAEGEGLKNELLGLLSTLRARLDERSTPPRQPVPPLVTRVSSDADTAVTTEWNGGSPPAGESYGGKVGSARLLG